MRLRRSDESSGPRPKADAWSGPAEVLRFERATVHLPPFTTAADLLLGSGAAGSVPTALTSSGVLTGDQLALFDEMPLPSWVFDAGTLRFLCVNQAAIERYRFSRDEFLTMSILEIRPVEERPRFNKLTATMLSGSATPDETEAALKEISNKPVRFILNTHHHGDHTHGNYLVPTATITLRPQLIPVGPISADVTADPRVAVVDPDAGVIPAQVLELPLSVEGDFAATGTRVSTARATGTVMFTSHNTAEAVTIPAGARGLSEGGIAFETTAAVTVQRAVFGGDPGQCVWPGHHPDGGRDSRSGADRHRQARQPFFDRTLHAVRGLRRVLWSSRLRSVASSSSTRSRRRRTRRAVSSSCARVAPSATAEGETRKPRRTAFGSRSSPRSGSSRTTATSWRSSTRIRRPHRGPRAPISSGQGSGPRARACSAT